MSQSIFSTLAYHAIFDYPLTLDEIHRYLISDSAVSLAALKQEIDSLLKTGKISSGDGLFFPSSLFTISDSLIALRFRRQKISAEKMIIAKRASKIISIIPWVKLVAVTGDLAMENADDNDDIDLMVAVSGNRLWIVRPLVSLMVSLFFKRRKPSKFSNHSNHFDHFSYKNHICLNLWVDEEALGIPQVQRDLYTAHELAQMKSVVNRDGTYEKMMWENRWGRKFLANAWKNFNRQIDKYPNIQIDRWNLIDLLNRAVFYLQLKYMRSKMTNERVSLHAAFFHPGNRADTILKTYDRLCHRSF